MKYSLIFKVQQSQFQIKLEIIKVTGENTLKESTLKDHIKDESVAGTSQRAQP